MCTTRLVSILTTVSQDDEKEETNRKTGLAYASAFSLFAAVVAGLFVGWLLDRWLGPQHSQRASDRYQRMKARYAIGSAPPAAEAPPPGAA